MVHSKLNLASYLFNSYLAYHASYRTNPTPEDHAHVIPKKTLAIANAVGIERENLKCVVKMGNHILLVLHIVQNRFVTVLYTDNENYDTRAIT